MSEPFGEDRLVVERTALHITAAEHPDAPNVLVLIGGNVWTEALRINHHDGTLMVSVKGEGTVEYGPDYDPDTTARTFWQALASAFKDWPKVMMPT